MTILEDAIKYNEVYGFNVIPVGDNKRPFMPWEHWQKERQTADIITEMFSDKRAKCVAIITGEVSGITVIDIDTPEGRDALFEILPEWFTSYPMVHTPRGGSHIYCRYVYNSNNRRDFIRGVDLRSDGGYVLAPNSQINGIPYTWAKGHELSKYSPTPMPNVVKEIVLNKSEFAIEPTRDDEIPEGIRDDQIFHIALKLVRGGMKRYEVENFLQVVNKKCCSPPLTPRVVQEKVVSAIRHDGNKTMVQLVEDFIEEVTGTFQSRELYSYLCLTKRSDKQNASRILKSLSGQGKIIKTGVKAGEYKILDNKMSPIDVINASDKPIEPIIEMPLGLHEKVHIMPKTINVIAGVSNMGKSAFALNTAAMNIGRHKIRYFSSEMDGAELKSRLQHLEGYPIDCWSGVEFYERSSNFADVVDPDGLNIIDFFEINTDFFTISKAFTDIREALNKGTAFICIQKDPHQDIGRGASFSIEKPRLYLTLDPGARGGIKIKIVKAKNLVNPERNPNGQSRTFHLEKGINIIEGDVQWLYDNTPPAAKGNKGSGL